MPLRAPFRSSTDTAQKHIETSLIERFLYPKFGPGQMWEEVARRVASRGGHIHLRHRVVGIERAGLRVTAVTVRDETTGSVRRVACDYLLSTLAVQDLAAMLSPEDERVAHIAQRLPYRDFMTVGLLLRRMIVIAREGGSERPKRHAAGQLDLHPGAGCENRPAADLQQLEPGFGGRPRHHMAGIGVFLPRGR